MWDSVHKLLWRGREGRGEQGKGGGKRKGEEGGRKRRGRRKGIRKREKQRGEKISQYCKGFLESKVLFLFM